MFTAMAEMSPLGGLDDDVARLLPPSYAAALAALLADAGDDVVADCAGVDRAALPALIKLALAKLREVEQELGRPPHPIHGAARIR